jgi:hypothetical protein
MLWQVTGRATSHWHAAASAQLPESAAGCKGHARASCCRPDADVSVADRQLFMAAVLVHGDYLQARSHTSNGVVSLPVGFPAPDDAIVAKGALDGNVASSTDLCEE